MNQSSQICMSPIGIVHSCFKEKFGIPRQPGLVPEASAEVEILSPYDRDEAFIGLQGFSHVWIIFVFHETMRSEWRPTVRPPRLGGNQRLGVFASRSTFRPNPIGMSVVELAGMERKNGRLQLSIKGVDLLDGTPVLDIKPYLPYADAITDARGGYAHEAPVAGLGVEFSPAAERECMQREQAGLPRLQKMITQLLQSDPRPAYSAGVGQAGAHRTYGMRLYDFDLQWQVEGNRVMVLDLVPVSSDESRNKE